MSIRIAIADDSALIRRSLRIHIEAYTDWLVCGEADDGVAAVALVQNFHPDVVILDLAMPGMNGLEAAGQITAIAPETRIVLFTGYAGQELERHAKSIGVHAVLPKDGDNPMEHLLTTLKQQAAALHAA